MDYSFLNSDYFPHVSHIAKAYELHGELHVFKNSRNFIYVRGVVAEVEGFEPPYFVNAPSPL